MSKLSDLITAKITNERAVLIEPYNINVGYSITNIPSKYHTKIELTAVLGCKYFLEEYDKEGIAEALKEVRKGVIQEIFGEFRSPLREIQHLIYAGNYNRAREAAQKLERLMFDV